jgi:hypothetical protein
MASLLKSRKFWIAILDVIISTTTFFVTKYVSPDFAENILWLIAAWQPVLIMLIAGIAIEDAAVKRSAGYIDCLKDI